jgi:hypothetical protein
MSGSMFGDKPQTRYTVGGQPVSEDFFRQIVGQQQGPAATPAIAKSAAEEETDRIIAAEQGRTERDRIQTIQRQLAQETLFRSRGFGLRSLLSLGGGRRSTLGAG